MASNKSKTPGPIQVVVVLMLSVLAFYFGNRFGQVFDFNTMEITDGALATVNSIVAAPAAISTASVPMLYAIGLAITVLIVWLYTFMYAGNYRYGEEAGSAKWGTLKEGVAFKDQSDPSNNLLFTKNYGLALKKPKFDLEHDRNLNVMVIGGSGSGKTRNYVKPNLMQLNASYFLADPKGTSLPECGYLFRDNGYRIKVFNTIEFNKSMHYNPLKYVALLGFDETKNYGVSFCKNFLATCLAGVIILFAMGLFPNLLSGFSGGEISGFKGDMWSSVCASVALMLIVIKSGTIARDVFGG